MVNFVAKQFEKENFSLVITPEGTRSWVQKWRKGFYHMALAAKVPIVMAVGDFNTKTMFLGYKIPYEKLLTTSYEDVLKEIQEYLEKNNVQPKLAKNWNPNIE